MALALERERVCVCWVGVSERLCCVVCVCVLGGCVRVRVCCVCVCWVGASESVVCVCVGWVRECVCWVGASVLDGASVRVCCVCVGWVRVRECVGCECVLGRCECVVCWMGASERVCVCVCWV